MKTKKRTRISRGSAQKITAFVEETSFEDLADAEEELRALQLDPQTVGRRVEQIALEAIRARMLREHVNAARVRIHSRGASDLTDKLN